MATRASGLNYRATIDLVQFRKNHEEMIQAFKKLKVEGAGLTGGPSPASFNNLNKAQLETQRLSRAARLELERLKIEEQQLINANVRTAGSVDELNKKFEENRLRQQELRMAMAATKAAQTAAVGSYKEAQQRLKQLGDQIKSVSGGFEATGKIQQARIREYNQLNERLKAFDATLGNHQRNVGNYKSALSGVGAELSGMVKGYLSAAAAIAAVGAVFNQSLKSDAVRTSLEFTFGSVDLADAKLEQLRATADRLGVNYNGLTSSYKSFAGAVIASNFDFEEGERIFNAVAGASSRLKLSSEDTEGALRALQQMISKGNVQAEELRGQLGERIPGAFSIAARAMGVTESQLNKMLQKGEVLATDLLPKLATELEKTFSTENEAKVEGLSAAWERLKNTFSATVSENTNISTFFTAALNGVGALSGGVAKLVNSSSWQELWARLSTANGSGDAIKKIIDASTKSTSVLNRANQTDLQNADAKTTRMLYEELTLSYKAAASALTEYKKRVADGSLTEGGKMTVAQLTKQVDLLGSKMNQVKRLLPAEVKKTPVKTAKQIQDEEDAAKKVAEKRADLAKKDREARNAIQKEIDETYNKAKRSRLTNDQQEIADIEAKYAAINEKVAKYAKDGGKLPLDLQKAVQAKTMELADANDRQETAKLKTTLDEQRELYEEYEAYKSKVGKTEAEKRYGAQVTYLEFLQQKQIELSEDLKQKGASGSGAGTPGQLKLLAERIAAEKKVEQKRFDDLLKQFETYAEKRARKVEEYELIAADLRRQGYEDRAKVAEEEGKKQVTAIDSANMQEWESYKALFDNLETMSKKQTLIAIEEYEKQLKAANITAEARKKAESEITKLRSSIANGDKDGLREAAEQLGRVASQFNDINGNIGSITSVLITAASSYVEILKGMDDFKTAQEDGDNLGKITAGLGIAGAAINVATSIVKFFKAAKESAKQAAAEMQKFQDDAIRGELAYNALLRERERTLKDISKLTIADLRNQQQLLSGQTSQAQKDYNRLLSLLRTSGQQITGQREEKYGGVLGIGRKTRTVQDTAGVAGLSYDQLEALFAQGKLTDSTKQWFSELQKAKAEMEAIGVSGQDVVDAINQVATGTTSNSIADAIIAGFRQGKRSAADFADDFKGLMTDAALSVFKSNFLNKAIEGFYKDFAMASEDGLSEKDVATLREAYSKIITDGAAKLADFDKIAGGSGNSPTSPGGLTGAIKGITEDTASLIAGRLGGMQVAMVETLAVNKEQLASQGRLYNLAFDHFNTTVRIEANTFRTANNTERLAPIETSLKAIDAKMESNLNALRAAGFKI